MKLYLLSIIFALASPVGRAQSDAPQTPPTRAVREPASKVLARFWKMEKSGKGLTPDGWRVQAEFLSVRPGPYWDHVLIVGDRPGIDWTSYHEYHDDEGDIAAVGAGGMPVAYLRPSMRLTYAAPRAPRVHPTCCEEPSRYVLRLSDKYWETEPDGSIKQLTGALAWRITEADLPAPWITLTVAIHYVTDVRDKTQDPVIKKNAEKTLTALEKFFP